MDCYLIAEKSKYISKALWKKSKKFELNCEIYNEYILRRNMKKLKLDPSKKLTYNKKKQLIGIHNNI